VRLEKTPSLSLGIYTYGYTPRGPCTPFG